MKNKIGIVLAVLLGFSALGLGVFQSSASEASPKLSYDEIKQLVKDQYPGEITEWELKKDRNKAVYEVEISNDEKEYDIKLDGNTGEVLKLEEQLIAGKEQSDNDTDDDKAEDSIGDKTDDSANKKENDTKKDNGKKSDVNIKEKDNSSKDKSDARDKNNGTKAPERTAISPSKAKQIAQKAFKGSIISMELDEDDGKRIYEVELKTKNKEAEIEIDAYTGEVIVLLIDTDEDEAEEDKDDKDDEADDNDKDEDDGEDKDDADKSDDEEDNEED